MGAKSSSSHEWGLGIKGSIFSTISVFGFDRLLVLNFLSEVSSSVIHVLSSAFKSFESVSSTSRSMARCSNCTQDSAFAHAQHSLLDSHCLALSESHSFRQEGSALRPCASRLLALQLLVQCSDLNILMLFAELWLLKLLILMLLCTIAEQDVWPVRNFILI